VVPVVELVLVVARRVPQVTGRVVKVLTAEAHLAEFHHTLSLVVVEVEPVELVATGYSRA
jgi:hypothetical protein